MYYTYIRNNINYDIRGEIINNERVKDISIILKKV